MINPLIDYINDDSLYIISCNQCAKKGTSACNTCSRKRTESKPKKECNLCSEKPKKHGCEPKKCDCEDNKQSCTMKRSVCNSEYFAVRNYFSELVHDWEKDLAKYNLGISELESINYFTDYTENGELLNKVLFVFRRGHEVITKEFLVAPKGEKGDKGDNLTWENLTDDLKRALKGEKGDPPTLGGVVVNYVESSDDVSGNFIYNKNTGDYDLHLTLPKQKTFLETINEIQSLLDLFNSVIDSRFEALNLKIDNHKQFDFSKLGLRLESDGKSIKLTYDGLVNNNSITLLIPELNQYKLRHVDDVDDMWNDTILLLKNGDVQDSIRYAKKYKPKDWWILPYPSIILMSNGELVTKKLRVSAWFSEHGSPAVDETLYAQEHGTERNYLMFLQTTASYVNKTINSENQWTSEWSSLNYRYDATTGILTLPENNAIEYNPVEGKNYWHKYTPGGFVSVSLYATDSRPRRCRIPVIDISSTDGTNDGELNNTVSTYYDVDPNNIPTNETDCYIQYTSEHVYDLHNFYDVNGNLINSWVKVSTGIARYKKQGSKLYFIGSFTKVNSENVSTGTTTSVSNFYVEDIHVVGKRLAMKISYLGSTPTYELTSNLYFYLSTLPSKEFDKVLRTAGTSTSTNVVSYNKYLLNGFDNENLYFVAHEDDYDFIWLVTSPYYTNRRVILKHGGNNDADGIYKIVAVGNTYTLEEFSPTPLIYFNTWLSSTYGNQTFDEHNVSSAEPSDGVEVANGLIFNNGLYVGKCEIEASDDEIVVSEHGDYVYVISNNSVQILNLTNRNIAVEIEGVTYELTPHGKYIDEEAPISDPVNH